jgi:transposase, IS6 family
VDETYVNVRGAWAYRYRALDSDGNTLEFVLSPHRHAQAAEYFFRQALGSAHTGMPRVINVDGNAAYPPAVAVLQAEGTLAAACELRPVKYLNNRIEQDHRFIKRRVKPGLGFGSYQTAWWTLQGYEAMNQIRKGQVRGTSKGDILSQNRFIAAAFGLAA